MRADALAGELTITSLAHTASGQTVTTSEVTTSSGIISPPARRGAPGRCRGTATRPELRIQLPDDELIRSWFRDELIEDLALVITLSGTTPVWP